MFLEQGSVIAAGGMLVYFANQLRRVSEGPPLRWALKWAR